MYDVSHSGNTRYASSIRAELRASHAGEIGAVWIYRGILLVNRLKRDAEIITLMEACNADEQAHRDEALKGIKGEPTAAMRLWGKLVGSGSSCAVALAKLL